MNLIFSEAFVELTTEEVRRFDNDPVFRKEVLEAANQVANETGRTPIIAGPDFQLGTWDTNEQIFQDWRGASE